MPEVMAVDAINPNPICSRCTGSMERIPSIDLKFEIRSTAIQISTWKGEGVPIETYYRCSGCMHVLRKTEPDPNYND